MDRQAELPVSNKDCDSQEKKRTMTTQTTLRNELKSSVIAIYETHERAEAAVKALQHQGFDMTKLSIVGRDYHTAAGNSSNSSMRSTVRSGAGLAARISASCA